MSTLTVSGGSPSSPIGTASLNIATSTNQNLTATPTNSGSNHSQSWGWHINTSGTAPSTSNFSTSGQPSSGGGTLSNTAGGNINSNTGTVRFSNNGTADTYYIWVKVTRVVESGNKNIGYTYTTHIAYARWTITTSDPTTTPVIGSVTSPDTESDANSTSSLRSSTLTVTVNLSSSGTGGTLQYGRNTSNSTPSSWQAGNTFTGTRGTTHYYFARRSSSTVSGGIGHAPDYLDAAGISTFHGFNIQDNFQISYGSTTFSSGSLLPDITSGSSVMTNLQDQCEYRITGPNNSGNNGGRTANSYDSGFFNYGTSGAGFQLTGNAIPVSANSASSHFLRVSVRRPVNVGGDNVERAVAQSAVPQNDTFKLTVTGNVAPTAEAGANKSVVSGGTVNLDGTGSSADTTIYSWAITTGSGATLSNANTATPTFNAPNTTSTTVFTCTLTATDSGGLTDTDTCTVTVGQLVSSFTMNTSTVSEGASVSCTNTSVGASSFAWSVSPGQGSFSSTTSTNTTWTSPSVDTNTNYVITLTVTGSSGSTTSSSQTVTVLDSGNAGSGTARSAVTGVYGFQVFDGSGNLQIRGTGERVARLASTSASSVSAGSSSQTITNPVGSNSSNSVLLWSPTTSYSGSAFVRSCPVHSIGATSSTINQVSSFAGNAWWMRFDGAGNSVPSHGMQITNSAGQTVVEQDYQGLAYKESGTSSSGNTYSYTLYLDTADIRHINFANSYSVAPFIALKGSVVCSPQLYWNGSAYTGMQIRCPKGATVNWAVVVPRQSGQTPSYASGSSAYGIRTYAADGSVNWDSGWQQVAVVDVLDVNFGFNCLPLNWNQSSVPTSSSFTLTFTQTPTKQSGWSWGTYATWYKSSGAKTYVTNFTSYSGGAINLSIGFSRPSSGYYTFQMGYTIRGTNPSGQAVEVDSLVNTFTLYNSSQTSSDLPPRRNGESTAGGTVNVISEQNDTDFDGVYPPIAPTSDEFAKGAPNGAGHQSSSTPQIITHAACPNAWFIFNAAFGNVRYRAQRYPYLYEGAAPPSAPPAGSYFIEGGGDHILGMTQKSSTSTSVDMTRLGEYQSWDGFNIQSTDYSRTKSSTSITPGGKILVCNINV